MLFLCCTAAFSGMPHEYIQNEERLLIASVVVLLVAKGIR